MTDDRWARADRLLIRLSQLRLNDATINDEAEAVMAYEREAEQRVWKEASSEALRMASPYFARYCAERAKVQQREEGGG